MPNLKYVQILIKNSEVGNCFHVCLLNFCVLYTKLLYLMFVKKNSSSLFYLFNWTIFSTVPWNVKNYK